MSLGQFLFRLSEKVIYLFMFAIIGFVLYLVLWPFLRKWFRAPFEKQFSRKIDETQEQNAYAHTEHWDYIKDLLPWQFRERLNKIRGDRNALTKQIKQFSRLHGIGPKVAGWILEEYMISERLENQPSAPKTWLCTKCGTKNSETAIFCKDCGEYK